MTTTRATARRAVTAVVLTMTALAVVPYSAPAQEGDDTRCVLPGGTIGIPELEDPVTATPPPRAIPSADAPAALPDTVHLRDMTQSFNRQYWFALHEGSLWFRPNREVTGVDGGWGRVATPDCLDGRITAISADDDELVALDEQRTIHQLDQILSDPSLWNWSTRWGNPFWTGDGWQVPPGHAWDWSVVSNTEDETWLDPAGNHHRIGDGKVSHIWLLGDDQQTFTYLDPWLPRDRSYEMCGPHRGRFVAEAMVSSGSTVMVTNRFGDLFTRVYDFDIAGADPVFFSYAYADQRDAEDPVIQLPGAPWVAQPKVPGEITDRLSIFKHGTGVVERTLRIEGRDGQGHTGYWQKDIGDGTDHPWINATSAQVDPVGPGAGDAWQFVRTDEPLQGTLLDNRPQQDLSRATLGPSDDRPYGRNLDQRGDLGPGEWAASLPDFDITCTPSTMRVEVADGSAFDLRWHVTDTIRQAREEPGITADPRTARLTIEVPADLWDSRDAQPQAVREFLATLDGRWTSTTLEASLDAVHVPDLGWTFHHDTSAATPTSCDSMAMVCATLRSLSDQLAPVDEVGAPLDEAGRELEPLVVALRAAIAYTHQAVQDATAVGGDCDAASAEQLASAVIDLRRTVDTAGAVLGDRSRTLRPVVAQATDVADLLAMCSPTSAGPDGAPALPSPSRVCCRLGPGRVRSTLDGGQRIFLPGLGM